MRLLFYLGHPAHFHLSNSIAEQLKDKHDILFVARAKDVLLDLVKTTDIPTIIIARKERKNSKFALVSTVLKRELSLLKISLKFKPDMLFGTDIVITHIAKLLRKPAYIFNEDDEVIVPFLAKFGFKYATGVFSPKTCQFSKYQSKKIEYNGFHKMTYLHPNYFKPQKEILIKNDIREPYILIRLSSLQAHHDNNIKGLSVDLVLRIIDKLKEDYQVYISSEKEISYKLKKYQLRIPPIEIHHILNFASLLIADSQSMSIEAALLGTPSIRVSDFVGRIGVFFDLEKNYKLSIGIRPENEEMLLKKVDDFVSLKNNNKELYNRRQRRLLKEKIDTNAFFVWFINNYPNSYSILKENPEYNLRFS